MPTSIPVPTPTRFAGPARIMVLAVAIAWAGGVHAVIYCVSTSQQLQNALTRSSDGGDNNGLENHIHLVQGLYSVALKTPEGSFSYLNTAAAGDLGIQGGYTSGCASHSPDAHATLLDGYSEYPVLDLASVHGKVTVSDLTVQHGEAIGSNSGGGMLVNAEQRDRAATEIFNVVVRENHSRGNAGGFFIGADGADHQAIVRGSLIVHNSSDTDEGAGEILGDGAGVLFYDNTVYGNTSGASANAVGGLYIYGPLCEVADNIIYNNDDIDLQPACVNTELYYNDVGSMSGSVDDDIGNVSMAPHFVDAAGQDFHLAGNSSLLGVSPVLFGDRDLDGWPYPVTGRQDMGAYEETVFVDGFEGVPLE